VIRTAKLVAKNRVPTTASTSASISRMPIPNKTGDDGSIEMPIQAVFPVDVTTDPMTYTMPCNVRSTSDGTNTLSYPYKNGDQMVTAAIYVQPTDSVQYYADVSTNKQDAVRTPVVFKNALISANGSTVIWTAGVGKKWRLMGWRATMVSGTTAAGACLLKLLDVAADTGVGVQICGAALAAVPTSTIIANETYMNGFVAAATNTALNINLSSVLAVAGVHVQVWGTEE
jgi:hypothetical protein